MTSGSMSVNPHESHALLLESDYNQLLHNITVFEQLHGFNPNNNNNNGNNNINNSNNNPNPSITQAFSQLREEILRQYQEAQRSGYNPLKSNSSTPSITESTAITPTVSSLPFNGADADATSVHSSTSSPVPSIPSSSPSIASSSTSTVSNLTTFIIDKDQLNSMNSLSFMNQDNEGDDDRKRRRGTLDKYAVSVLRQYLFDHFAHPYPTDQEKAELAIKTGLKVSQVNYWFINARVRIWRPLLESHPGGITDPKLEK